MRRALGFALAAGLLAVLPTSSARAQFSYGYDSWYYNLPSAATYWNGVGYSGVYTDRTTAAFNANEVAPYRGVAPFNQPPFGTFGPSNGLVAPSAAAVAAAPAQVAQGPQGQVVQQPVRVQRRPILSRLRGRR